ncbi:MAG: LacI family DNA-binding transcriptional regulator [Planctomycetota bacterium]
MSIVKVAESAGVSHSTVSRVINNRPGVSNDVARRVRQAMERIGYTPPAVRRGPQARGRGGVKTGSVAMLIFGATPTLAVAPVAARALHAIESSLAEEGWGLVLGQVGKGGKLPASVSGKHVDGLILYGQAPPRQIADQIRDLPSVWLLSQRSTRGFWGSRVQPDNEAIGRLAAEYLADQGCRELAFIHLDRSHIGFEERAEAFKQTALASDLNVSILKDDRTGSAAPPIDPQWIATQVDRLAELSNRPTGIFLPRVSAAGLLYRALRSRGIEPGRDVTVVTCDQDAILSALEPQPATIDVQPDMIGRSAAKLLLWHIQERMAAVRTNQLVEPRLVEPEVFESPSRE